MKFKSDDDEVMDVKLTRKYVMTISKNGYYCYFDSLEVPVVGVRGAGVKAMNLKDDELVSMLSFDEDEYITLFTNQKTGKRVKMGDLVITGRARKGNAIIKKVKSTNYQIMKALNTNSRTTLEFVMEEKVGVIKNSEIPILDVSSTGSVLTKKEIMDVMIEVCLSKSEPAEEKKEDVQVAFDLGEFKL